MRTAQETFKRARLFAGRHMAAAELAKLAWGETTITELVIAQAAPAVTVLPFTQRAERSSGADWVWWWVDASGAYGMLVQAKRLTISSKGWGFKFDYRSPRAVRLQREVLVDTARTLGLLPVYALYLGTGEYRQWRRCPGNHRKSRCPECVRRTISLMPALLATDSLVNDAASTYRWSRALEDLWKPPEEGVRLLPALERQMSPDLAEFLKERPDGTRAVVRSMIDRVLIARAGQFAEIAASPGAPPTSGHDDLGGVFGGLPDDTMHGGVRYFQHTLDPFTPSPPSYVLDVMAGESDIQSMHAQMPDSVGGIVVVSTPSSEGSVGSMGNRE